MSGAQSLMRRHSGCSAATNYSSWRSSDVSLGVRGLLRREKLGLMPDAGATLNLCAGRFLGVGLGVSSLWEDLLLTSCWLSIGGLSFGAEVVVVGSDR